MLLDVIHSPLWHIINIHAEANTEKKSNINLKCSSAIYRQLPWWLYIQLKEFPQVKTPICTSPQVPMNTIPVHFQFMVFKRAKSNIQFQLHNLTRGIYFIKTEVESTMVVTRNRVRDNNKLLFNKYQVVTWDDEKHLEMDGSNDCITIRICLGTP